jgi:hypothetical protein
LKFKPVPVTALVVTVELKTPPVLGVKVTLPVVQVAPDANTLLAVQVPKGRLKSVASERLKGVEPKVTAPLLAVKVTAAQVELNPTEVAEQATGTVAAESVP